MWEGFPIRDLFLQLKKHDLEALKMLFRGDGWSLQRSANGCSICCFTWCNHCKSSLSKAIYYFSAPSPTPCNLSWAWGVISALARPGEGRACSDISYFLSVALSVKNLIKSSLFRLLENEKCSRW